MPVFNISTLDINSIPKETSFVLDANILFFLHSGFYSSRNPSHIAAYSKFIAKLLARGNKLYITTTSLQEFLFGFERKSYKLYVSANGYSTNSHDPNFFPFKQYRSLINERYNIKKDMDRALYEVISYYNVQECSINLDDIDAMVQTYDMHRYDPMDYFSVCECKRNKLSNHISDDHDFQYDSSINVYCVM